MPSGFTGRSVFTRSEERHRDARQEVRRDLRQGDLQGRRVDGLDPDAEAAVPASTAFAPAMSSMKVVAGELIFGCRSRLSIREVRGGDGRAVGELERALQLERVRLPSLDTAGRADATSGTIRVPPADASLSGKFSLAGGRVLDLPPVRVIRERGIDEVEVASSGRHGAFRQLLPWRRPSTRCSRPARQAAATRKSDTDRQRCQRKIVSRLPQNRAPFDLRTIRVEPLHVHASTSAYDS